MKSTITVQGIGKASGDPDIAVVEITVENRASTAAEARNKTNAAAKEVVAALKQFVAENDLVAVPPRIRFNYQWDEPQKRNEIIDYTATTVISAKVRDMEEIDSFNSKIAEFDPAVVQLTSFQFGIEKRDELESRARIEAFAAAKARAELYAAQAGKKLRDLKSFQETYVSGGTRRPSGKFAAAMAEEGAVIEKGDIEVQVTVTATYIATGKNGK